MATPGSAEESLRLANHYRQLPDEELIALAQTKEALTEAAQQALASEVLSRKLTIPRAERRKPGLPAPPPPPDPADENDPYAEERQLFEICTVWSQDDARRVQYVLDSAGIPFFIGSENATCVDDVTSNYSEGIPVKIMRIGWPWAFEAIRRNYFPKDEPGQPTAEDVGDVANRCPRCKSTDVIFEQLIKQEPSTNGSPKFRWKCPVCGKEWDDDGVQTKE